MHIRRHRSSIDWSGRGGNLLRVGRVEESVITAAHPSAGRSSGGCRSQPAPRSLRWRAVLATAILCIAASGGCTSNPAPKRVSVVNDPDHHDTPAGTPTWTELHPPASPPARSDAPMAYDAATRTVLLFGGEGMLPEGKYGGLSDTWSWNGTTWTKLSPAASPAARYGASMAYDPGTEAMLLFGDGYDRDFNGT